jgi:cytoskeletal protein CcmA (bactofilin family)
MSMWKRDEAVRPTGGQPSGATQPPAASAAGINGNRESDIVNIGKSVVIKGELNGSEDLTIEGQVEGTIQLKDHVLTIGPHGRIRAQVFAKSVVVLGEVTGNVNASEKVDIRDAGSVDGDIVSPRVAIAEGAHFRGSVDMQRQGGTPQGKAETKTAAAQPAAASSTPTPAGTPAGQRVGV